MVLLNLSQPLTATQIAKRTQMARDHVSDVVRELGIYKLCYCCNPESVRGRVVTLTKLGRKCRERLLRRYKLTELPCHTGEVDCNLLGWAVFRHRASVIKVLDRPMRAVTARKLAISKDSELRMSSNNARDVLKLVVKNGIAEAVEERKQAHPIYQLTDAGRQVQTLLYQAESPGYTTEQIFAESVA